MVPFLTWLLITLQDKVPSMELCKYILPQPQTGDNDRFAWEYCREIDYDQVEQQAYVDHNVPLFTADQQDVYNYICSMIDRNDSGMVFSDALSGTIKLTLF